MEFDFNKYQSRITDEILEKYPQEIQEQFLEIINGIPFVKSLIAKDRPRACELETDDKGRIIVDVTKPHILEDMDYFRPAALHYKKYGCYTNLAPNSNPNSEYGKWIREEIRRCYEGYMRKSDGEWITGDYYFFLNYCPIQVSRKEKGKKSKSSQRLIDFPNVWDGHYYLFHYLEQARENGHHACMLAARGKGKAHPYSQKVLTLNGWKKWGDLHIGDYVYGDNGEPTKIIDIPFDDECDIYNVTLRDGRVIQCSDGHLFKIKDHSRDKIYVKSLKEIMLDYKRKRIVTKKCTNGIEYNYRIPKISNYVVFKSKQVSIDPYTLGLLIGDGCFRINNARNYITFTCDKKDIVTYKNNIPYEIDKMTNDSYTYCVRCSNEYLRNVNLWGLKSEDKFIPSDYLYNDYNVRLNLLKGLMDSDGTVDKTSGIPIFYTTSERLKNDFEFLCRSLGFNISTSAKIPKCNNKEYLKCYKIRVVTNVEIFNLKRKQELVNKFNTGYSKSTKDYTTIVDISYSHREKAKCITVDNESHCYIVGDFVVTHNSYTSAARIAKRFILGESKEVCKKVQCVVTASERKYIQGANQVLDMFVYYIDFIANNTQFPAKRLVNSLHDMQWTMGYIDAENNTKKGTLNSVTGITSKDDESKLRGSRGQLYVIEEAGSFPRLLQLYAVLRPSVEDGSNVFGQVYMYGTAGDNESDFSSMQEIMYNPKGYNMQELPNVYDLEGQGRKDFTYFFPSYLNMAECYDEDGNSDVIKALLEILKDRYIVKYNSTDIRMITKRMAELPITPKEAVLQTANNLFPITELQERLLEIDNNPSFYNDTYVGELVVKPNGEVEFKPTTDTPIREFKVNDNNIVEGALEIFEMPVTGVNGKIPPDRYIIGHDPVDNDEDKQGSLSSTFVLDLWTDRIVAEYTGRKKMADDNFEVLRRLCLFYNAKCLYEQNIKGCFAYFSQKNCLHLLADTPEYLVDKQLIKSVGYGNTSKGVRATLPINNYANKLIQQWMLKPIVKMSRDSNGQEIEVQVPNLFNIKNRALLRECIQYTPLQGNYDRIRALGLVMLYREEKVVLYQGQLDMGRNYIPDDYIGNDPFFNENYNNPYDNEVESY